jgi:hypothetical protein
MSSNIRITRVCQYCGYEFEAKTTVTKYCSELCAKRNYKARKKEEKAKVSNAETKAVIEKPIHIFTLSVTSGRSKPVSFLRSSSVDLCPIFCPWNSIPALNV